MHPSNRPSPIESGLLLVATLQIVVAAAGSTLGWAQGWPAGVAAADSGAMPPLESATRWLTISCLAVLGVTLRLGERDEPAARLLGACFFVAAAAWSMKSLQWLAETSPLLALGHGAEALSWLPVESLLGWLFLGFVSTFPRASDRRWMIRLLHHGRQVLLVLGLALVALALWISLRRAAAAEVPTWLLPLDHARPGAAFVTLVYLPCVLALGLLPLRWMRADTVQRQRARLFVLGVVAALLPVIAFVVVGSSGWLDPEGVRATVLPVRLLLLTAIVWVSWAVFLDTFDVRLLVQRLASRRLLRLVVGLLPLVPAAALLLTASARSAQTVGELWGRHPVTASLWLVLAFTAPLTRSWLLERCDRWLGLDRRSSDEELVPLARRLQDARRLDELCRRVADDLIERFDATHASLTPCDDEERPLVPGTPSEIVGSLFAVRAEPLLLERASDRSALAGLSAAAQGWLQQAALAALVPVRSSEGRVCGLLLLGERRSQEAYTDVDRDAMVTIAAAVALALERLLALEARDRGRVGSGPGGAECVACHRLAPEQQERCSHCGAWTAPARVPHLLPGRLLIEQRIGEGSGATVYRGRDLVLQRVVAVKALRDLSSASVVELRHEARSLAAVEHPRLMTVYWAELHGDTLLLVAEHLDGGSLAERLEAGAMPWREVLVIGLQLCEALEAIHLAGFVHGDVKPANVGFDARGEVKLIDFGLARLVGPWRRTRETAAGSGSGSPGSAGKERRCGRLPSLDGTALYAPPEAWNGGETSGAASDLWALSVTLWQALHGAHPAGRDPTVVGDAMRSGGRFQPAATASVPQALDAVLRRALHHDPAARYPDATGLGRALRGALEREEATLLPLRRRVEH